LDDLIRMHETLKALPKPVSYVVLDNDPVFAHGHHDEEDAQGRRYIRCSPGLLDNLKHVRAGLVPNPLFGISVYRREDMPGGWPDA
jgi:hypothetical protein